MSDVSDLLLKAMKDSRPDEKTITRLATVTAKDSTGYLVLFDGETVASTRRYKAVGTAIAADRVVMLSSGSTWVLLGAVDGVSGWVDLANTLGSGALKYQRAGAHVSVYVSFAAATASGTTYTISSTAIPSALAPELNARGACDFSGFPGTMVVLPSGNVQIAQSSGLNRAAVEGLVTYPMKR